MNQIKAFLKRVDWINASFLLLTPVIAVAGLIYWIKSDLFHWQTLALFFFMLIVTGVAITGGYHRLFSHKSYDASSMVKWIYLLFGAAAFQNTALRWSSDHRNHHKFVDTDQDPYNIKRGFWYAHMGWVMLKYDDAHRYSNVADLEKDPIVMFQHKYCIPLGIAVGFLFPTVVSAFWGDPLGGFFLAGFLRTVLNHHFTFSINSFAHLFGKRPYSDQNTSRDSWFLALLTYGEGYHNYHHKFPSDYRNGIRSYQWDPTKWLIKGLEGTGHTYNLRQVPNETILRARLKMDEKRMLLRIQNHTEAPISHEVVAAARHKIEHAYAQMRHIKEEYRRLKAEKIQDLSTQWHHFQEKLAALKADLREARRLLREAIAEWAHLCGRMGVPTYHLAYS